jgi:two-component system, NarL family, response regulator DevR
VIASPGVPRSREIGGHRPRCTGLPELSTFYLKQWLLGDEVREMSESLVKLMLVDDHRVVRSGLALLFNTVPRFTVVGEAGTVAEAVAEAHRCRPDIVLMDVRLPDGSGVEACREIRSDLPDIKVLMLTSYADEEALVASIVAGASGYFLKQSDPDGLVEAVMTVATGGSLMDQIITGALVERIRLQEHPALPSSLPGLGELERKVLSLIATGKTNHQISLDMSLSEHDTRVHVSNILRELQLTCPSEATPFMNRP